MKRYVAALLVLLAVVGVVGVLAVRTGFADEENGARAKCSEATLHGTYLFANDGVDVTGNKQVPFAAAGYDVFDGNGKMHSVASVNSNGHVVRKVHASGTYTLKLDCTGTVTFAGPDAPRLDLFVAPDGSKFTQVGISPPKRCRRGLNCERRPSGLAHRRRSSSLAKRRAGALRVASPYLFLPLFTVVRGR